MPRRLKNVSTSHLLELDELPRADDGTVDWDRVFGRSRPRRVEIGVGNSPFLIELARIAPQYDYVGFEYAKKRVFKFLRKVEKAELDCIRMLALDAMRVLEDIFAPASVDHVYINHPDPWPKRRHAKHRLVQQKNIDVLWRLLAPEGGISLRTDADFYAAQMLEVLDEHAGFASLAGRGEFAAAPLTPFRTPFEEKYLAAGQRIYYLEYVKAPAPR